MIKVLRSKKNISITGHAMYDDLGKDIVCSAVSSVVITSLNGILSINPSAIIYNNSKDGLEIEIKSFDDITLKLIDNMMELIIKLSNDYPKNIQVKEGA